MTFTESSVCAHTLQCVLLLVSSAILNDVKKEESLSPPLSFAEEIKLLASSAKVKTSMSDSTDPRHV